MAHHPIVYRSKLANVGESSKMVQFDVSDTNGIKCTWSAGVTDFIANFTWEFDWKELSKQGVDRLTGYIDIKEKDDKFQSEKMEVDFGKTYQFISKLVKNTDSPQQYTVNFEYSLIPHYTPPKEGLYDALFAPSHLNDTVLVIEGKKLHVNKAFLSYQSEYFEALFSKNFKEGSLSEIEIKDISYDDFGLLCSSFYPNPQFPNDGTVEKLLEMGRRFLLPTVKAIVEYHLLHNSVIVAERMIRLADEYGMEKLLEKFIGQIDSLE